MRVTDLEKADIGQYWRDQQGVVWEVREVTNTDTTAQPRIVLFVLPKRSRSNLVPIDRTAFGFERGWEKIY